MNLSMEGFRSTTASCGAGRWYYDCERHGGYGCESRYDRDRNPENA
jgi:hypothetical protein